MLHALLIVAAFAAAGAPKDDSPAPCESASLGPLDVCTALATAAKTSDFDTILGHSTAYCRSHFGRKEKLAIEGLHNLMIGIRCVKISKQDDAATPPRATVWVYAPEGKSRDMPFVKEHDFWRFDFVEYEAMHGRQAK